MKIEIGKYITRDGRVATITRDDYMSARGRHVFQFTGKVEGEGDPKAWPIDGRWYVGGEDHGLDLVERLTEVSIGQYKTRAGLVANVTRAEEDSSFPMQGTVDGVSQCWTKYGRWTNYERAHGLDLIERISNIADVPRTGKTETKPNGFRYEIWARKLAELATEVIDDRRAAQGLPPAEAATGVVCYFLMDRGAPSLLACAAAGFEASQERVADLDCAQLEAEDAKAARPEYTYSAGHMTLTIDGVVIETLFAKPAEPKPACAFEVGKCYKCKDGTLRRVVRIDDRLHVEFPENPGSIFKRKLDGSSECCAPESLIPGAVPEPWTLEVSQRVYDLCAYRLAKAFKHLGCTEVATRGRLGDRTYVIKGPAVLEIRPEVRAVFNTVLDRARVSTYRFKATAKRPIDWARIVAEAPKGWSKLVVRYGENLRVSTSINPAYPSEGMNSLEGRELGPTRLTQNFGSAVRGPVAVEITFDI
jgi:hypothetical protein